MALIALRSPQFKFIEVPAIGTFLSVECKIRINTVNRYTLYKNSPKKASTINFDISELARDYLDITYDVNYVPQTIDIVTTLSLFEGLNGTGAQTGIVSFTDVGFESYGEFEQGTNPTLPTTAYLISKNTDTNEVQLYYPLTEGFAPIYTGKVPQTIGSSIQVISFSGTDIAIGGNYPSTIKRIGCTKYGQGRKIIFINKFGVQQDLWFFLKETKTLGRKNEGFKSNTLTYPNTNDPATYSISDAPNKVFNTTAKQTFTLSSGYYPEQANQFFEQLLLSEYVWFERPKKTNPSVNEVVPVKVKTSSMAFKTSVNDRLIEYTIDFEEAFDYINNIR